MSDLRADIFREVERVREEYQGIEVTVDAIMALIEADKGVTLTGLKPGVTYYARVNGQDPMIVWPAVRLGEPFEGVEPMSCPAVSPDGYFCCLPRVHEGDHAASNGDVAVAVWR